LQKKKSKKPPENCVQKYTEIPYNVEWVHFRERLTGRREKKGILEPKPLCRGESELKVSTEGKKRLSTRGGELGNKSRVEEKSKLSL